MKGLQAFIFTLLALTIGQVFAEGSTCIRFRLEITLQNDEIVIGDYFYYVFGRDLADTASFDDILLELKNANPYAINGPKLTIYKKVGVLDNPKCWGTNLYYCLNENIAEIHVSQIKKYLVLEKTGCHPDMDKKYGYKNCGGCQPEIITEININEVKMLADKPKVEIITTTTYERYFGDFCRVFLLSYGTTDSTSIMKILDTYITENELSKKHESFMTDTQYDQLKDILREKKIIMFKTYRPN
jgi:hypothetical protein